MKKWFVLSASTILSKRGVTQSFGSDNTIVIPLAVLEEIQERYESQGGERGKIAREFLDYVWSMDQKMLFRNGVIQRNGSKLQVVNLTDAEILRDRDFTKVKLSLEERYLVQTCKKIQREFARDDEKVILVSRNTVLRMKAGTLGIEAQTYKDELLAEISEQYTGRIDIRVPSEVIDSFYQDKRVSLQYIQDLIPEKEFLANMFVVMKCGKQSALGRVEKGSIVPLTFGKSQPYGVIPKNVGQRFMIEALMMDQKTAPLVIVKGPAGTAKTFLSLAAGLQHVLAEGKFKNKILISRSPTETGESIGYLPGNENAKIGPYMRGVIDNLKNLHAPEESESEKKEVNRQKSSKGGKCEKPQEEDGTTLLDMRVITVEAIGFIRGRSICDTFIIIDEAQNLTQTEIKTIITRVGEGTKLVIIGDPAQIDRPELNERNNGLSYASERMKGVPTCWQITMEDEESVRSELAKIASKLL
ncbi:MAG: PhoH family protein [Clostridia bacterium]|jgi:PhoH-like ATPase|nr:PhoH family protein [Clostridia bacterium]